MGLQGGSRQGYVYTPLGLAVQTELPSVLSCVPSVVSELRIKAAKYHFHTRLTKLGKTESQHGEGCREPATLLQDDGKARAYRLSLPLFVIQSHRAIFTWPI